MIHKILLWICGIASILGIVLYVIDKTTKKSFSWKLSLCLLLGGILVAIILAITEPSIDNSNENQPKKINTNQIKKNKNSPVANSIENQTNNYHFDKLEVESVPKTTAKSKQTKKLTTEENVAESKGQKDGITANKVNKTTRKDILSKSKEGTITNKVTSTNQQGGITANTVNVYADQLIHLSEDNEVEIIQRVDLALSELAEGKDGSVRVSGLNGDKKSMKIAQLIHELLESKGYNVTDSIRGRTHLAHYEGIKFKTYEDYVEVRVFTL